MPPLSGLPLPHPPACPAATAAPTNVEHDRLMGLLAAGLLSGATTAWALKVGPPLSLAGRATHGLAGRVGASAVLSRRQRQLPASCTPAALRLRTAPPLCPSRRRALLHTRWLRRRPSDAQRARRRRAGGLATELRTAQPSGLLPTAACLRAPAARCLPAGLCGRPHPGERDLGAPDGRPDGPGRRRPGRLLPARRAWGAGFGFGWLAGRLRVSALCQAALRRPWQRLPAAQAIALPLRPQPSPLPLPLPQAPTSPPTACPRAPPPRR